MSVLRLESSLHNQTLSLSSSLSYSLPIKPSSSTLSVARTRATCLPLVTCSVSKVHNYGTVDYERRPIVRWNDVYRRISLNPDPDMGSAEVLNRWENEGKTLTKWELSRVVKELRKYKKFRRALEVKTLSSYIFFIWGTLISRSLRVCVFYSLILLKRE